MTESTGYRARLGERYAHREAYIRANWRDVSDRDMSDFLGVVEGSVAKYRQNLGLWRKEGHGEAGTKGGTASAAAFKGTPLKPKGCSREQLAWARENAQPHRTGATGIDQEAGLMLVHHADWAK